MITTYLFVDPAFWIFSALYLVMLAVAVVLVFFLLPQKSKPDLSGQLPMALSLFFAVLVAYQFFHQAEHVAQMFQFKILHFAHNHAHGIIWFLDFEWNHFLFNTGYLAGLTVMTVGILRSMRRADIGFTVGNVLILALGMGLESWHWTEHAVRIIGHISSGCESCPGIIDRLFGISRLHLHFWYNFFALAFPMTAFFWYGAHRSVSMWIATFLRRSQSAT